MTFTTIITASLLGVTSAAITPGPAVTTTVFPVFGTPVAPTTATTTLGPTGTTLGSVLAKYNLQAAATLTGTAGPIRGYRNGLVAFPTQSLVVPASTGTGDEGTIAAQVNTRTFYQTTTTLLGAQAVSNNGEKATASNGSLWNVCVTHTDTINCPRGVNSDGAASASVKFTAQPGGVVMKAGSTSTATALTTGGSGKLAFQLQYNADLALASMYHSEYTATTDDVSGAKWCSAWDNKILKSGTVVPFSATYGLAGRTKCSWVLTAEDATVGPSFRLLTTTAYVGFFLHWVEWGGASALATTAKLPAADAAAFFLGAYAAPTNGALYLNPLTATGTSPAFPTSSNNWAANALFTTSSYVDPYAYYGGTIGTVKYFPGMNGDAKEIQIMELDQLVMKGMYDMTSKTNDQFNSDNSAYEKLRTVYEDAKTAETARLADALKAAFEPVIAIPSRPCAPSRPMAYSGVALDLASTVTYPATFTLAGTRGQLKVAYTGQGASAAAVDSKLPGGSVKAGFVYPTADTSVSTKVVGSAGHVFGRLGQSDMTLPGGSAPFSWDVVATAEKAAMMVSAFPALDADAGLVAATNFVRAEAKATVWATLGSFNAPGQPGAPTAATTENAKILALGAASALVFVTLA